jgi:hypothetical protein
MGGLAGEAVDPVVSFPFRVGRTERVVTAGSCFAQHIARYLTEQGFNHYIAERPHTVLKEEVAREHNYGMFSARYGNIYTARQLRQLLQRAHGRFVPKEEYWLKGERYLDPFRPQINPGGFHSLEELRRDRKQHLERVLHAFKAARVFVFTLGLTEAWVDREDGAVFPICPGVEGGTFSPDRYAFVNFSLAEVLLDMKLAIQALRRLNPKLKIILTVSPVPLAATAEDRHVLVSTTLSKSVLRVAADTLSREIANVAYFPSYEIITGNHAQGRYFDRDLRSVTEEGVRHVMRLFFQHAAEEGEAPVPAKAPSARLREEDAAREVAEVLCDEALLDPT